MGETTSAIRPSFMIPGTKEWLENSIRFANNTASSTKYDCRNFANICLKLIQNKAWNQYFSDEPKTWERLCKEAIHDTDPVFIDVIIKGVQILESQGHQGPIPASLAEDVIREKCKKAEVLKDNKDNSPGPGRGYKTPLYNKSVLKDYGTSQSYLIRRLKRDHKSIFDRLSKGHYPSVRAAALEAGIVKKRVSVGLEIDSAAKFLINNFTKQEIDEIIRLAYIKQDMPELLQKSI